MWDVRHRLIDDMLGQPTLSFLPSLTHSPETGFSDFDGVESPDLFYLG